MQFCGRIMKYSTKTGLIVFFWVGNKKKSNIIKTNICYKI